MTAPRERPFRLHWSVDCDGVASCGAGAAPSVAVPARSILDVDCKRCMALPGFKDALRAERAWMARPAAPPAAVIPIAPYLKAPR